MSSTRRLYLPASHRLQAAADDDAPTAQSGCSPQDPADAPAPRGARRAQGLPATPGAEAPPSRQAVPATRDVPGGPIVLDEDEAHYGRRVLRLHDGADVLLLDGNGQSQAARVHHTGRSGLTATLVGEPSVQRPRPNQLTLVCAVAKGERADWLVEKVAELGVFALAFTTFERSSPAAGGQGSSQGRTARWQRLARAAGRQAQHGHLPAISGPEPFAEVVARAAAKPATCVALSPSDCSPPLPTLLQGLAHKAPPSLCFVIGPEGGLTQHELQALDGLGYHRASLGPYVLRLETAAVVAAAAGLWSAQPEAPTSAAQAARGAPSAP